MNENTEPTEKTIRDTQLESLRLLILGSKTDSSKDDLLNLALDGAEVVGLNILFPFNMDIQELDVSNKRICNWQVRCAKELYSAIQRDGIKRYAENNLDIEYLESQLSSKILFELVPKAGVPKSDN